MSLTIELPPDIEQELLARAHACGMPPAALAVDLLRHALEENIDRALEQSAAGKTYGPGTALLQILGVLHGKRNATRLLRERL